MDSSLKGKSCVVLMATYDDWQSAAHVIGELDKHISQLGMKGRIVVVDDSSNNLSGKELIPELSLEAIESVEEIQLGSNQGNQRAMAIGVSYVANNCKSDYMIVMDSDNEDKPDDVPTLLQSCLDSNDREIIFAERTKRSESFTFKIFYKFYKYLYRVLTGSTISVGNFCAVPGHMISRIAHLSELWNHFPAAIIRAGLPFSRIPTNRGIRLFGKGKMNLVKLIVHAFSGFVIHADIVSVRVILLASWLGIALFSLTIAVVMVWLNTDLLIPGWTSQMLMLLLLLFTLILSTALNALILVLSLRMQLPMIPIHDYERFIYSINLLRGTKN